MNSTFDSNSTLSSNETSISLECTIATCPMSMAYIGYVPSHSWNTFFLAFFSAALVVQIVHGVRYRTWGFLAGAIGGLLCEIIGYVGRLQLHDNPFKENPFLMSLCTLTIGPAFLSASIYLCLSRLVVVFGEQISFFQPRTYTITFMCFDLVSLILQAVGGAIASTANDNGTQQTGINVMIAGLVFQVVSLSLFLLISGHFALRVYKRRGELNPKFEALRQTAMFKAFLCALLTATITIYIRSTYRVAELVDGFHGKVANQQTPFIILEGIMVAIAVMCLCVFHPGVVFKGNWLAAGWSLRRVKNTGGKEFEHLRSSNDSNLELQNK